jgi:hypothetical protein
MGAILCPNYQGEEHGEERQQGRQGGAAMKPRR